MDLPPLDLAFTPFPKIPRLSRDCTITEKIDGTNASIYIDEDGCLYAASRKRWITPDDDNYGFARWVEENAGELCRLGYGHHFGEWWGQGIQRKYGMDHKVFSLFNTFLWSDESVRPKCCSVVPIIYKGIFDVNAANNAVDFLRAKGSQAAPGWMKPEGIVIYHEALKGYFKKTLENDEKPKGQEE